jgi:acyl-[acyl-carrier-protein]-phospholipid O-acyltransferase/long-chain-fatty-acid--[acyl-carrier-protein] ligase
MAHGGYKELLRNGGFQAFLWTQFLGAFNDSFYQTVVLLHAEHVSVKYVPISLAVFNLPFLLFSGYAGHLADAVSKRRVMIWVKAFEMVIMLTGLAALVSGSVASMLVVMFLLGLHSTVFSPAKYGIVPEMWPDRALSRANALLEMSTFVAMVLGMSVGAVLFGAWHGAGWRVGIFTLALAVAGFLTSLRITPVPPSGAKQRFRWNPLGEVVASTRHLLDVRPLWLTVMGVSYFWFLGALFKMVLPDFGSHVLHASDTRVGMLWTFLAVGVGTGNLLAGRLSGNKVELGLVPLGSLFMAGSSFLLYAVRSSYALSVVALAMVGVSSGLFVVPLYAYMQQRSGSQEKGRVVAANNFYQTVAMLLASGALLAFQARLGAANVVLAAGILTVVATAYILTVVPEFFVRFSFWLLTHTLFRIRILGPENVPFRGPALLVANHMSHVDGFLIGASVQRFIRFMVWKPYYDLKPLRWFFRLTKSIPVATHGPRDMAQSIRAARGELAGGHVVCIFAEGAISRTGNMLPFKHGMEKIVERLDVPIIPVHLDRLWGSMFSFERGRFFWKWPRRIPYPVTVSFGAPMPSCSTAHEVRQAVQELSAEAVERRQAPADHLGLRLVRNARRLWSRFVMADSSGRELTWGRLLTAGVLVSGWVRRTSLPDEMIGVVLPPSVGGALVNVGITLAGRVPVNLNFTAGREAMAAAVERCRIRTIVSSKLFLAKARLEPMDGMVYLEDLLAGFGKWARLRALLGARFAPARFLAKPAPLATVIFSSGSTGEPKGVMLSHRNVIANIEGMAQVFWIGEGDRLAGVLPFFHSFGYTVTIWFPLVAGCGVVYHPNPTDARAVGELVAKYKATLLLSTPTFCATYVRKCACEEFRSLRFVLVGAEKLRDTVAAAFREKFGLELLEGYGCTEMAPVVAVNGPDFQAGTDTQIGNKPGTVGHPLPGVAAKIVDPVTFQPLAANQEGLLLVKGPNRMLGYLGQARRTEEAIRDGWYVTGDVALIDDEGFLRITDRLARFSKIAGEMVPHLRIEDAISRVIGESPCVVTAVSDGQRGERLVALYVHAMAPCELWQHVAETNLPRQWLPKRENFYQVEGIPQLGTGKLDLRGVKTRAQELAGTADTLPVQVQPYL